MNVGYRHNERTTEELVEEATFVRTVDVRSDWEDALEEVAEIRGFHIVIGDVKSFELSYAIKGDAEYCIHYKEQADGSYKYAKVAINDNRITKFRAGKFSKVLAAMNMSQKDIKHVMTARKSGTKQYSLWTSNDFYHNYNTMEDLGVCKSCMSHSVAHYDVELNDHMYSPLIAYEKSANYSLALLRDETKFLAGEYPFVARAVICHHSRTEFGNQYTTIYGNDKMEAALRGYASKGYEFESLRAIFIDGDYVLPFIDEVTDKFSVIVGDDDLDYFVPFDDFQGTMYYETDHNTGLAIEGNGVIDDEEFSLDYELDGDWYGEDDIGDTIRILYDGTVVDIDEAVYVESLDSWRHIDTCVLCEDTEQYELEDNTFLIEFKGTWYNFARDDVFLEYKDGNRNPVVNDAFREYAKANGFV